MIQKHIDRLEQEIKDNLEMIELLDSKRAEKIKNSSEYQDYITSKEWEETRRLIFKKYDYKCAFCGANKNLHVHHITYENLGEEKDGDLVALCSDCHKELHEGKRIMPFHNLKLTENIVRNLALSENDIEKAIGEAFLPIITETNEKARAAIKELKERWDREHS